MMSQILMDFASWLFHYRDEFAENGFQGIIDSFIDDWFTWISNILFNFLSSAKHVFIEIGDKAVSLFSFQFNSNFLFTICGVIFGFFILKFALGKLIDYILRLMDPM